MKHTSLPALLSFAVVCVATSATTPAFAQKAIVVVRHAEKVDESRDPLLSAAGLARAEALAKALKSLDIKAVYVTQFQRTTLTAAPTMSAHNLKPIEVSADATPELVERMKKDFPNDVVMTIGHSNSVPRILKALGATEVVEIADTEFDSLFIVVPAAAGPPTVLRLRY
ncbi:MAG: histidine phosphatase family protein [Vicinamibacteria bacterium]